MVAKAKKAVRSNRGTTKHTRPTSKTRRKGKAQSKTKHKISTSKAGSRAKKAKGKTPSKATKKRSVTQKLRKLIGTKKTPTGRKKKSERKYGKTSQDEVKKEMRKFKQGKAHSGVKLKPVKSREQAIAIALSKARKKGAKVPRKNS